MFSRFCNLIICTWEDYLFWQKTEKKVKRINDLLKDILCTPFTGIGKPEPKHKYLGFCSRRIDDKHCLIYKYNQLLITKCRFHYD